MKFLVVTNRKIRNKNATDENLFGEQENDRGASEFRLAWAERNSSKQWKLELIDEPKSLTLENLPSRKAYKEFVKGLVQEDKNALVYVHGYDSDFTTSLNEAHEIAARYGVGILLFAWPSNPGGFVIDEYRRAQTIASNSIAALDRVLEKLAIYGRENLTEDCKISINFLAHSLGNRIFEKFVRDPIFTGETRLFDNIVLNAADVDSKDHHVWGEKLLHAVRVFATINERDNILNLSDIVNPDRLGNTARNLSSSRISYFDLTDGKGIGKKHRHFESSAKANEVVLEFFKRALNGKAAFPLEGISLDPQSNAHRLDD